MASSNTYITGDVNHFINNTNSFQSVNINSTNTTIINSTINGNVEISGNPPLHTLNFFKNSFRSKILNKPKNNPRNTKNLNCPNSKIFYENTISIPTFTFEKKKLINQYISAFKKVCFYLKYKKL